MDINIEKELNKLLKKSIKSGEVPVAALITCNGKIISKAYNKVEKNNNVLMHAEIICLIKASKKLKNWRLNNCVLYVTLEPCSMCKEIIKKFRIEKIIYYIKQNNYKTEKNPEYIKLNNNNYSIIMKNFFRLKR